MVTTMKIWHLCTVWLCFTVFQTKCDVNFINVLYAIEKLAEFYKDNFHAMNIDGIFGIRILEGHVTSVLHDYYSFKLTHLEPALAGRIQVIKDVLEPLPYQAMPRLKKLDHEYFEMAGQMIMQPWNMWLPHQKLDPSMTWPEEVRSKKDIVAFDEQTSDACMHEISSGCKMSEMCLRIMSTKGMTSYAITHQILYTMWAMKQNCTAKLETNLVKLGFPGGLSQFHTDLCTNNFNEMKMLVQSENGTIRPQHQDLLMEVMFVCPSLGFYEFLTLDFLTQLLQWQKPSGCFGTMASYDYFDEHVIQQDSKKIQEVLEKQRLDKEQQELDHNRKKVHEKLQKMNLNGNIEILKNAKKILKQYQNQQQVVNQQQLPPSGINGRHLLSEKDMPGGCLAHKTAVASGALTMYLRYILDPGPSNLGSLYTPSKNNGIPDYILMKFSAISKVIQQPLVENKAGTSERQELKRPLVVGKVVEMAEELDKKNKIILPSYEVKPGNRENGNKIQNHDFDGHEDNVQYNDNNYYEESNKEKLAKKSMNKDSFRHHKQPQPEKVLKKHNLLEEASKLHFIIIIPGFAILFLLIYRFIRKRKIMIRLNTFRSR